MEILHLILVACFATLSVQAPMKPVQDIDNFISQASQRVAPRKLTPIRARMVSSIDQSKSLAQSASSTSHQQHNLFPAPTPTHKRTRSDFEHDIDLNEVPQSSPKKQDKKNKTIEELINERPSISINNELDEWYKAFDSHPDIEKLNFKLSAKEMEEEIRKMRGNITVPNLHTRLTLALKRNFQNRGIPSTYITSVFHHWERFRDQSRKKLVRLKFKNADPSNEAHVERLKNHRVKDANRAQLLRDSIKQKGMSEREILKATIIQDLNENATLIEKMWSVEEMEMLTRPTLDKYEDVNVSRQALHQYLLDTNHSEEYAEMVEIFSRHIRTRERRALRDEKLKQARREQRIAKQDDGGNGAASDVQAGTSGEKEVTEAQE